MFSLSKMEKIFSAEPSYRLAQARRAVFVDLISDWNKVKGLPKEIREKLEKECPLKIRAEIKKTKDGQTMKAIIFLSDDNVIETALMRHQDDRWTICLSSQVGCPMGCSFCATGAQGFIRNLTTEEILIQFLFFARALKEKGEKINGVVFMGMGEPFANYSNVLQATRLINKEIGIGARHISFSTAGVIAGIKKLATEPEQFNLAISLHAPDNSTRSLLMPINKKQGGIEKLLLAVADYLKKTGRRVMIEYLLIKDVNDAPEQAQQLADLLAKNLGRLFFVNLISYNATGGFEAPDKRTIREFKKILEKNFIEVTERFRLGRDIDAACGQLAGKNHLY